MENYKVDWLEVAKRCVFTNKTTPSGKRVIRCVLKLDNNYHVYAHGGEENMMIEEDEKGTYLKLYFKKLR